MRDEDDDLEDDDDDEQPPEKPSPDRQAGYVLLDQLKGGFAFDVVSEEYEEVDEITCGTITLKISETDVETSAFGLLFTLAVFSFKDALPAGYSKVDFQFHDELTVADFLNGLAYQNGSLHFQSDYVRGRLMKTNLDLDRDGLLVIQTMNRDRLAGRWLAWLMKLKMEDDEDDLDEAEDSEDVEAK